MAVLLFQQANIIMSRYSTKMNVYFWYISDGIAAHPGPEIVEMLKIKAATDAARSTFNYSILIGATSSPAPIWN